ncbi:two-component system response regulator YesN [Paenibacillus endophyticus]|uniref:Two-component system response regulator YesN n=1 Tax=Paenibacillus endophyticus TaxID=1294268 RepID=A0A7W5CDJ2_9BACL|nr:response regulator [Paenibacillus endophyticus]MBB3155728.1 two-component system response regulator YesN [Paenibacillus endophyticus]
MYKLFIADDEQLVVETLSALIDWNASGIRIVGTANNGKQALERILQSDPDIVLTDIRMPGLNGLELIRALREKGRKAECIIVSGYSEFKYAKEAIELEAVDYLIKPAELEEVAKTVSRAIERLERKADQTKNRPELRIANALDRAVFTDLIVHGKRPTFDQTPYERYDQFAAIVIGSSAMLWLERMKNTSVTDALLSFLANSGIFVDLLYEQQKVILLCMAALEDYASLTEIMMAAAATFSNDSSSDELSLSFGIGPVVTDIMHAHISFLAADKACQMGLFFGVPVMDGNSWPEITRVSERLMFDWSDKIRSFVRFEQKEFEELLDRWMEWGTGRLITPVTLKKVGIQWANRLHELIEQDYGIKIESVIGDRTRMIDGILEAPDWASLQKQCQDLAQSVQFYLNVTKTTLKEKVVQEIKTYLESHYHENIQLDQLAERFDLNSSYVSNLYSKSTGKTLLEYVTLLRIQKAKQMLRESSFKIFKISQNVGYDNQRYFCQVFKKHVGVSPGQYREDHMIRSEGDHSS